MTRDKAIEIISSTACYELQWCDGITTTELTTGDVDKHLSLNMHGGETDYENHSVDHMVKTCKTQPWVDKLQYKRKSFTCDYEQKMLVFREEVTYPRRVRLYGCKTNGCYYNIHNKHGSRHLFFNSSHATCESCSKRLTQIHKNKKYYVKHWKTVKEYSINNYYTGTKPEYQAVTAVNSLPKWAKSLLKKQLHQNRDNEWANWGNCEGGLEFFKAIKDHKCEECGCTIMTGDDYITTKYFYDARRKYHLACFNETKAAHVNFILGDTYAFERVERMEVIKDMFNSLPGEDCLDKRDPRTGVLIVD